MKQWQAVVKRFTNNAWGFVDYTTVLFPNGDVSFFERGKIEEYKPTILQIVQTFAIPVGHISDNLMFVSDLAHKPPPNVTGATANDAGDTTLMILTASGKVVTLATWHGGEPDFSPPVAALNDIMRRAAKTKMKKGDTQSPKRSRSPKPAPLATSRPRPITQQEELQNVIWKSDSGGTLWENDSKRSEGYYNHLNGSGRIGPFKFPADAARDTGEGVLATAHINNPVALRDHDDEETLFFWHDKKLYEARVVASKSAPARKRTHV